MRSAQSSNLSRVICAPSVSVPVPPAGGIYDKMRTRPTRGQSDDELGCVLAEYLLYNVALAEITLDLSECELLECWDIVLERYQPQYIASTPSIPTLSASR